MKFSVNKHSLWFKVWLRHALSVAVIMGIVAIVVGWGPNLISKFSFVNTARAESRPVLPTRAPCLIWGAPSPGSTRLL
jgi:hypothetical protein